MQDSVHVTDAKFKPEDCDRLFIAVNASQKKSGENNPDKSLCRSEFLEVLIRAALKKYCESGETENEGDAVDRLWKEFFYPYQQKIYATSPYYYDQHRWRMNRFWNEQCDNIFKAYASLF